MDYNILRSVPVIVLPKSSYILHYCTDIRPPTRKVVLEE